MLTYPKDLNISFFNYYKTFQTGIYNIQKLDQKNCKNHN